MRVGESSRPEGCVAWRRIVAAASLAVSVLVAGGCVRHVPEVRGRVVDAVTGVPIARAMVKRELYRPGELNLVDTRMPRSIPETFYETRTDREGRFVLPPVSTREAIAGMGWMVFEPGYMPSYACHGEPEWKGGGCSGFGLPPMDAWLGVEYGRAAGGITMEVRLHRPTVEGVTFWGFDGGTREWVAIRPPADLDPWASYFARINSLVEDRWLDVDAFAREAVAHLLGGSVTSRSLAEVDRLFGFLGGTTEQGPCFGADLAYRVLLARDEACVKVPHMAGCENGSLSAFRSFLDRRCSFLRPSP